MRGSTLATFGVVAASAATAPWLAAIHGERDLDRVVRMAVAVGLQRPSGAGDLARRREDVRLRGRRGCDAAGRGCTCGTVAA